MSKPYKVGDLVECDGQICIVTLVDKKEEVIQLRFVSEEQILRFAGDDEDEVFDAIMDL